MYKVCIIIPTFQRCSSVKRALSALDSQSFSSDKYEVIVSIDGSQDGTKEMVMGFDSQYKLDYIWEPNSGRAFACNRGIRKAKCEVLIIIDDDMEPCFEFVEAHYKAHSKNSKLGVMGAAPILIDQSSSLAACYIAEEFNSRLKKMADTHYKFKLRDFYGGNFSIRLETLLNVGEFNESFKGHAHEDIEFAHRLSKKGVKIVYDKDARCIQYYDNNFKSLIKKTISSGKSTILLYRMHPDTFEGNELATYNSPGWTWRFLRLILIWSSMLIPFTNDIVISFVNIFKGPYSKTQSRLYSLAMDYSMWLGAWLALREDKDGLVLKNKIKSHHRP